MDKYDLVLDLIEHPAKYTPERIEEILSDTQSEEIYNLLCKTESALAAADDNVDVDAEWQTFTRRHNKTKSRFHWSLSRAASIAAIAFTSLAAVAIGITVAVRSFTPEPQEREITTETSVADAGANYQSVSKDSEAVVEATAVPGSPVLFEDAPLEEILNLVAEIHGVTVEYRTAETAQLHLYYKFDPNLPLRETIEQLNTFGQIDIRITGKKILVD